MIKNLTYLSNDEIYEKLMALPIKDILNLRLTNKRLNRLITNDKFWCRLIKRDYNVIKNNNCLEWYKNPPQASIIYVSQITDSKTYENILDKYNKELYGRTLQLLNNILKKSNINIKRGDILSILNQKDKYRNDGSYIFDGKKVIYLEYSVDDYGHVPKEFNIKNFDNVRYWEKSVYHNAFVPYHITDKEIKSIKLLSDDEKNKIMLANLKNKYNIYFIFYYEDMKKKPSFLDFKNYIKLHIKKYGTLFLKYEDDDVEMDFPNLLSKKSLFFVLSRGHIDWLKI